MFNSGQHPLNHRYRVHSLDLWLNGKCYIMLSSSCSKTWTNHTLERPYYPPCHRPSALWGDGDNLVTFHIQVPITSSDMAIYLYTTAMSSSEQYVSNFILMSDQARLATMFSDFTKPAKRICVNDLSACKTIFQRSSTHTCMYKSFLPGIR